MSDHLNDDDAELAATARRVSAALHSHADGVEPRHDAYARLASRVNEAAEGKDRSWRWWLPTPRMAVASAAVVAALAGAVAVLDNTPREDAAGGADGSAVVVDSATTTTAASPGVTDAEAADAGATDTGVGIDDGGANRGLDVPFDGGIVRDTKAGAARAFLDFVGIVGATVTISGDEALVSWRGEGGEQDLPLATLRIAPAAADDVDRWVVVAAESEDIVIDTPGVDETIASGTVGVTGRGTGFESWVDVELVSSTDGRILAETGTGAGNFGELAPFETSLPLVGTNRGWVVVRSSTGADGIPVAFAAVPISFTGTVDDRIYHVVRIEESDPDEGLNLRAGPGTDNEIVDVLDRGAAVTRRPGVFPVRNGASIWWPVEAAGGNSGWAVSAFLAAADPISDEDLVAATDALLLAAGSPDVTGRWLSLSPVLGVSVFTAEGFEGVPASELRDPSGWTVARPSFGGRSLAELLAVPPAESAEIVVEPNPAGIDDPAVASTAARYFGGAPTATAEYVGTDGSPRRVHVLFETSPSGATTVIGLVVESL